ncbi:uncharacterized protein C8Q71DRAFT_501681 [Rhodofomes roseus]|uniref:DUF6533 domain-containing protein n=1 Tax=Rhodofomes roseus TaxID=34475 RepID=A0ABQ8KM59_9APHY|nr:uncharacterized protein C8Q71DRAFT_501681 [Rhodofomes roseus]KAH9839183.1 hypothetical protein C8Q71DRAFT_501681 [Rhodofomes roseus]
MALLTANDVNSLIASQYLSGAAVTLTLYDHILIIGEIALVWRHKRSALSVIVILDLYARLGSMLFIAYVNSGLSANITTQICRVFNDYAVTYGLLSMCSVPFALTLRIYKLWDNRKMMTYVVICGFAVINAVAIAFSIVTNIQTSRKIQSYISYKGISNTKLVIAKVQYNSSFRMCTLPDKPVFFIGAYAGSLASHVYVLVLVLIHALSNPRRSDAELFHNLYRDGILTLLMFIALELARLIPAIVGGVCIHRPVPRTNS